MTVTEQVPEADRETAVIAAVSDHDERLDEPAPDDSNTDPAFVHSQQAEIDEALALVDSGVFARRSGGGAGTEHTVVHETYERMRDERVRMVTMLLHSPCYIRRANGLPPIPPHPLAAHIPDAEAVVLALFPTPL